MGWGGRGSKGSREQRTNIVDRGEGSRGSSTGYDDCSVVGADFVVIVPQGVGGVGGVLGRGSGIICTDFFDLGSGVKVNNVFGVEGMQIINWNRINTINREQRR